MSEEKTSYSVIKVEHVSKTYKLFDKEQDRLKEALSFSRKKYHKDFHALHDISLEIRKGEVVGIIGQNGSGKSTLLKIIAGVLTPTSGSVHTEGTMASLLELGAGFNPELNGIENVYMNGYIMGFTKEEMDCKLEGILDFADIGDFVYQPVKTYSSGMFVRLAFASAISADPDILIVDEALSVGDIAFQNKCFAKFDALKRTGTTILFVTHSLDLITRHCQRALFLQQGNLVADGVVNDIINLYTQSLTQSGKLERKGHRDSREAGFAKGSLSNRELAERDPIFFSEDVEERFSCRSSYNPGEFRWGDRRATILDYCLDAGGQLDPTFLPSNSLVTLYVKCVFHEPVDQVIFGLVLKTIDGVIISGFNTRMARIELEPKRANEICIMKYSFKLNLTAGKYALSVGISEEESVTGEATAVDRRNDAILFEVTSEYPFTGIVDLNVAFDLID